ncbi:MAG: lysophospholipase [Chloroflexota bacterium]
MTDIATAPTASTSTTVSPSLGTARMADGTTLRTLHWAPAGDAWAEALIVHGLGEHGGRYETVAEALTGAGIDTWAYDHRGNGGSGGPRVWVERWSILHDDLQTRLTALRDANPGRPLVLYGHSMGGLIALGYALSEPQRPMPDLLVLSAPGIEATIPDWKKALAGVLTSVLPKMKIANGLPAGGLSRDPSVNAKADADPLCSNQSTTRFGAEAFKEQDRLRALLPTLTAMPVPTYILHGSADPIVPVRVTEALGSKAGVTRRVHEGLRHECHHEPEQQAVLAEVVTWIKENAGAVAPA